MQIILLVEDNEAIIMGLEYLLKEERFRCLVARNRREAERMLKEELIDLALLDVSLPDGNGFELCQQIKASSQIPVIFLTARDEEQDVVLGFDLGADDYIMKPFRNRELISRIRNVLRRYGQEERLVCRNIWIDPVAGIVYRDKEQVFVTKLEYKLLLILFSNPRKLFTRDEILGDIWDAAGNFVNDNTLTVTIKRLREKLGDKDGSIIETVRGRGYRLGR